MIVLWLSELITDYGLGNGASLLIYTNIISNLPNLSKKIFLENSENITYFFWNRNSFINFCFIIWNCIFTRRSPNYSIDFIQTIKSIIFVKIQLQVTIIFLYV